MFLRDKSLNKHVTYKHSELDTLSYALDMRRQYFYMTSTDLTDVYYSVPLALCDQKYLLFQFNGVRYKYVFLQNDFSSALKIFKKLLKPVISILRWSLSG